MPFWAPPPPPVSYSQQVAPILALHCNSCHGDSGGFSTRTHAELMAGGNSGILVFPGEADRSLLLHFIDGRRGEAHRMPLGGRSLSSEQIDTIRRWIAEGAKKDQGAPRVYTFALPNTPIDVRKSIRVFCRVNTPSYLTLTVRDTRNRRTLLAQVASIKLPKERGDAGEPGELIWWDIHAGTGWPKSVDLELLIEYAAAEPKGTEFFARPVER